MKVLVVHHSADYDGLFSGCVANHWLTKQGHDVDVKGWDFGDEPAQGSVDIEKVYVLDLPPDAITPYAVPDYLHCPPTVWIDHHKSSIEKWNAFAEGFRIDGVAACRLAWQYFQGCRPSLQDFKERQVDEPFALTLAGEYDVWDKSDPDAEKFQYGLTANGFKYEADLKCFLLRGGDSYARELCREGEAAMKWQQAYAAQVCQDRGYKVVLDGLTFWCLPSPHARNSMWFPQSAIPAGIDGLMCVRIQGNGQVSVSLYHCPGEERHDLSTIAQRFKGGGHRGACGFSLTTGQAISEGILA